MSDRENEVLNFYKEWKNEVLEDLRDELVKDLFPHKHFSFLRVQKIFDEEDEEEIKYEKTRKQQAECFINKISKKGPAAFDNFCESLLNTAGSQHLLEKLLEAFEKKTQQINEQGHIRNSFYRYKIDYIPEPGQIGGPPLPNETNLEPPPPYYE
ncbi:B-cell lymphoma/leukemia 10 [Hydra vulgaris]|uniref:B-cell lymphoma/leukemia 10 n=1 Tax=Hydra vulgaris TaxID=6087 RepID=UPI000641683A|nr:B-cell lymphoma/leukemia 10 [Hydra vulgaris]